MVLLKTNAFPVPVGWNSITSETQYVQFTAILQLQVGGLLVQYVYLYTVLMLFVIELYKLQLKEEIIALSLWSIDLAPVVQTLDSTIHRINHYPVDSVIGFPNTYPLDSDLSGG